MEKILKPDTSYWDIFDHVEKVSTFVETIGGLSPGKTALFGLLFLVAFIAALAILLPQTPVKKENRRWWFLGFIVIYAASLIYIKMEAKHSLENNSLKKRVLNEMVYRLSSEVPALELCNSLSLAEPALLGLSQTDPTYFHYRKDNNNKGFFSVVHAEIIEVINQKNNDLVESIAAEEIVSIDSIKEKAKKAEFGNVTDIVLKDIFNKSEKLVYSDKFRVVELKIPNKLPFAEMPEEVQEEIVNANFDLRVVHNARLELANPVTRLTPNPFDAIRNIDLRNN